MLLKRMWDDALQRHSDIEQPLQLESCDREVWEPLEATFEGRVRRKTEQPQLLAEGDA